MKNKIWQKITAVCLAFVLILNPASPLLPAVYADDDSIIPTPTVSQEITPTPTEALTETPSTPTLNDQPTITPEATPIDQPTLTIIPEVIATPTSEITAVPSPTNTELSSTPTPAIAIAAEPATQPQSVQESTENSFQVSVSPSEANFSSVTPPPAPISKPIWNENENGSFSTTDIVSVDTTYQSPFNENVSIRFRKLPKPSGAVTIKDVPASFNLTDGEQIGEAYEITSTMTDGTFLYDLTLPLPIDQHGNLEGTDVKAEDAIIVYSEDGKDFQKANNDKSVDKTNHKITITSLDHFTVFLVTTVTDFNNGISSGTSVTNVSDGDGSVINAYEPQDQSQTTGATAQSFDSTHWLAQTFTAGQTGLLTALVLSLKRPTNNFLNNVVAEIRNTSGGEPGSTMLASTFVAATTLPDTQGDVMFVFSTPAPVISGDVYTIVVYRSGTNTADFNWYRASATGSNNPYTAGNGYTSDNSGSTWNKRNSGNGDQIFTTYIDASYGTSGIQTSNVLDTGSTTSKFTQLSWNASVPDGTGIAYYIRTSNTVFAKTDITPDWVSVPSISPVDLTSVLTDTYRYFQWRVALTGTTTVTPILADVLIVYNSQPNTPTLVSPADKTVIADNTPKLDWIAASPIDPDSGDTVKYDLQVDNNSDFSSPIYSQTGLTNTNKTTSILSQDTYYWRVRAVDNDNYAGNWTTPRTLTIDTTDPSIIGAAPTSKSSINSITASSDVSYTLSETIASGTIKMTRTGGTSDGSSPHTCTLKGNALNSGVHNSFDMSDTTNGCTSVQSLVNGTIYTFAFNATDLAGNTATQVSNTAITFDNVTPIVTVTTFPTVNNSNKTAVTLSGDCENGLMVSLSVADAGSAHTVSASLTCNSGTWTASSLNLNSLDDSALTATVSQTDAAGNLGTGAKIATKDVDAPILSLVHVQSDNPNASKAKVGDAVIVSFIASESVTGASVTIAGNAVSLSGSGTGPYSAIYTMASDNTEGIIPFSISGFKDSANNAGAIVSATTDTSSTTFDKTAPVISDQSLTNISYSNNAIAATSDNLVLTANVSDNNIATSQISADFSSIGGSSGVHPTTFIGGVATWANVSVSAVADGTKTITIDAADAAGNNATQQSVNIEIDNVIPTVNSDSLITIKDTSVSTSSAILIANDTDSDNDTLSLTDVGNAVNGTVGLSSGVVTFTPITGFVGTGNFAYTVTDGRNIATGSASIVVNPSVDPSQNQVLLSPTTNLNSSSKDVIIGGQTFDSTINIPSDVTDATLDLSNVTSVSGSTKTALLSNTITLSADTSLGTLTVQIPAGIQISGNAASWNNGKINIPTVQNNSTVFVPAASGFTNSISSVVEIGYGDVALTFDKGVRILIAGQAGKLVGYSRDGIFTQITDACPGDTQTAGNALAGGGDCYINVGTDLVIWTKHFTKFATYTQTINLSSSSMSSTSNGGVGDGRSDGLGCGGHDCSGIATISQGQTSNLAQVFAQRFTPEILDTVTNPEERKANVTQSPEKAGEVAGNKTSPKKSPNSSSLKTAVEIIIVLFVISSIGFWISKVRK